MTGPIFAAFVRYQGQFIPGITLTDWWYAVEPVFPGGTKGTAAYTHTGPVANAGLNNVDICNLQWQVQSGAIGYNIYRATGAAPALTTPWWSATNETGVKDRGFPAATYA